MGVDLFDRKLEGNGTQPLWIRIKEIGNRISLFMRDCQSLNCFLTYRSETKYENIKISYLLVYHMSLEISCVLSEVRNRPHGSGKPHQLL